MHLFAALLYVTVIVKVEEFDKGERKYSCERSSKTGYIKVFTSGVARRAGQATFEI